jgi:hypothetical protein
MMEQKTAIWPTEKINLNENILIEKKKYEIRKAGDGYAINGPLKPGQPYHKAPRVDNVAIDDGLFDNHAQALKHVKKIGGILRSADEIPKA